MADLAVRRAAAAVLLSAGAAVQSQIVRDGTVGPPGGPLQGPAYDIPADLGQQTGNNLFHSFSQFNINKNEAATFFGPPEIANVLARVTGGTRSNIDGLLRTSGMPNANFFLLNPAGVLFGPDAQLDVAGAFVVATADEIRLADGGRFSADSAPAFDDFESAQTADSIGNRSLLFVRNGNSWHGVRELRCPQGTLRKVFIVVIERATLGMRLRRLLAA